MSQGGARASSGVRGLGEQRKSTRLLNAGGGIMGSQKNLGTASARNSSHQGPRGPVPTNGLAGLNRGSLNALDS